MHDVGTSYLSEASATKAPIALGQKFIDGPREFTYSKVTTGAATAAGVPVQRLNADSSSPNYAAGLGITTYAASRDYTPYGVMCVATTAAGDWYCWVQTKGPNVVTVPNSATAAFTTGLVAYIEATGVTAPATTDANRVKRLGHLNAATGVAQSANFPVGTLWINPVGLS